MNFEIVESKEVLPGVKEVSEHSMFESLVKAKKVKNLKVIEVQYYESENFKQNALNGWWKRKADFGDLEDKPSEKSFNDFNWSDVMVPDNYGLEALC